MPASQSSVHASPNTCIACPVRAQCPLECGSRGGRQAEFPVSTAPVPYAGKMLYGVGSPAFGIFVVRAGCLKTVTTDAEGSEHVRGFHFPGDLVGLDALGAATYPSSAVALEPSQVCRISKGQLQQLAQSSPASLHRLLERASSDLHEALAMSGNYTAEQRVAAFLLEMEGRLARARGAEFELPMTRRDVAHHLRLATETVCRVLGRFADHGWLVSGAVLKILDRDALEELARPTGWRNSATRLAA